MFKFFSFFLFLALFLEAKTLSQTQVIMSTFITISLDEKDKKYLKKGFEIFKDIDNSLSSYKSGAKIYQLNNELSVELDSYTYEALKLSQKYYKETDGYFDITIGSITKNLYRFGEDERVVSKNELQKAKVGMDTLKYIKFKAFIKEGTKIDLGGIGKGFGVDKVAEYFKKNGVNSAIIAASGDIRCLSICKVDIQNPFENKALLTFKTKKENLGVTTSGSYNRFIKTIKHNHLINPKLKKPQTKFISITLIGSIPSAGLDAYATAVSVMPIKKAYKFLNSIDVAYVVLKSNKELTISKNIDKYTDELLLSDTIKNKPRYIYYKAQKHKKR